MTKTAIHIAHQSHVISAPDDGKFRGVGYLVDLIDGENVTLMRSDYSDGPFWIETTVAEIVHNVNHEGWTVYSPTAIFFAPRGECAACDADRENESTFRPSHEPLSTCRSGGRNHCTCSSCF
jgi:hypothetical protein